MANSKLSSTENDIFHIYSDESSHDGGSEYMAIGATFLRKDAARELAAQIDMIALENQRHPVREFHWKDMQKKQIDQYKKLVTTFIEAIYGKCLRFTYVLIHSRKLDVRSYSDGDPDLSLTKLTFGPVYQFASRFGPNNRYFVFLDERQTKHPHEVMLYALNNRPGEDAI